MSKLSDFYNHEGLDDSGRTLAMVWDFNVCLLEEVHDYIQWLFPLNEESRFNPTAPLLTDEDVKLIDKDNVRHSFEVMCNFYGIKNNSVSLVKNPNTWMHRSSDWLTEGNHNFLRLTRMIKSLKLFGLDQEATILILFLEGLYEEFPDIIGEITLHYWVEAS